MASRGPHGASRSGDDLREVAGYHLLRTVGEGGMSRVFLSYDLNVGSSVAVKVLADHLAHSREFVGRFYREARLSRLLTHPNLVRGLGAGYDPVAAKHYIILEFVDGPTAHAALAEFGRFSVGTAVQIGIDIAHALAFLHSRQYVHRDVKPDNILLHADGVAKLADLGLAKRLNDDPQITSTHLGVGTSYYMAYEQALNANFVDGRSDIFALGASLYHLLTNEVPFPGATHEEVVREKQKDTFRPLRELNPDVPPELAEIIASTLALDPRSRIQTAAELAESLESTGLAAPIRSLPGLGADGVCRPGIDSPTRADIPLSQCAAVDSLTVTKSYVAGQTPTSSQFPSSRSFPRWTPLRGGLALLAALGLTGALAAATGFFSSRSETPPSDRTPVDAQSETKPVGSPDTFTPFIQQ